MRAGIVCWLGQIAGFVLLGEVNGAVDILAQPRFLNANIFIIELGQHARSGLDTIEYLKRKAPTGAILVLSMHSEEDFGLLSLKAGAAGYLSKKCGVQEFCRAVQIILAGQKYMPARLTDSLLRGWSQQKTIQPHEKLSAREFQISKMIAAGHPLKAVAANLSLRQPTVSTYRARILDKLGIQSNAELTLYFERSGLEAA